MSDIIWPEGFVPGFTDNFCSNEVIVAGLSTKDIWPLLNTPHYGQLTMLTLLILVFMTKKALN